VIVKYTCLSLFDIFIAAIKALPESIFYMILQEIKLLPFYLAWLSKKKCNLVLTKEIIQAYEEKI
jgi:hypothetical protein